MQSDDNTSHDPFESGKLKNNNNTGGTQLH
jgi:hypothetical protein